MKLKVLKPGKWGINQPGPEVIVLSEEKIGEVIEHDTIDMKTALLMEDTGYIEIVEDDAKVDEDDPLDSLDDEESGDGLEDGEDNNSNVETTEIKTVLQEIIESATGKVAQKTALETWAVNNLNGFELDKRKSLEDCVEILIAEHAKLNG